MRFLCVHLHKTQIWCVLSFARVSIFLPHSRCVCGGPCPWGLLFWFNSAPHGWTQSDTSNPVKGDVQWSWSYTTAAPRRKDGLVLRRCLHVQTLLTPVETAEGLNFKHVNKAILTCWHEEVPPNCLIVVTGTETRFMPGNKQHIHVQFSTRKIFWHGWSMWDSRLHLKINPLAFFFFFFYFFNCQTNFKAKTFKCVFKSSKAQRRDHTIYFYPTITFRTDVQL